jgi:hypothetical protein
VRIESRPGRAKLIYTVQQAIPSFKLPGFELRCAAGNRLTVQDVLPPSIHPVTNKPYQWRYGSPIGHWSKAPPLPPQFAELWSSLIAPTSPKLKHPTQANRTVLNDTGPKLRELLKQWEPDCDYDQWVGVGMAIHHETNGAAAGLAIWNEWSASGEKYEGIGNLEQHWRSFRVDHANPLTLASLRRETAADASEFPADPTDAPAPGTAVRAPASASTAVQEAAGEALRAMRRGRLGTIEARISNICSVLGFSEVSGQRISLDTFLDSIMIAPHGTEEWRPLIDTDYTSLRVWLETNGNCDPIPTQMMREAVHLVAEQQKMDTAQIWLGRLEWDGVPRVETFCPKYFGTFDREYERAAGRYLWTALVGRIMAPGCQADMVPVLVGRQGVGKSRGVQALVPVADFFTEVRLDEADDVIARKLRGVIVGEMAEMRGLRGSEIERVKAFITRTHEKWIPKYKEFATHYPRRFLLIGTTNDEEFLPADSEHRRWLPLHTSQVDVAAIKRDREQLWAEALEIWMADGIHWQGMDELAADARKNAAGSDSWIEEISVWLGDNPVAYVRLHDVMASAIGLDIRHTNRSHELRVGRALRELGYERTTVKHNGRAIKAWVFDPTS